MTGLWLVVRFCVVCCLLCACGARGFCEFIECSSTIMLMVGFLGPIYQTSQNAQNTIQRKRKESKQTTRYSQRTSQPSFKSFQFQKLPQRRRGSLGLSERCMSTSLRCTSVAALLPGNEGRCSLHQNDHQWARLLVRHGRTQVRRSRLWRYTVMRKFSVV